MKIGGRHKGDANPLKLEPEHSGFLGFDFIEDHIAGVDNKHKAQEGTESLRDPAPVVVRGDVDEQGK